MVDSRLSVGRRRTVKYELGPSFTNRYTLADMSPSSSNEDAVFSIVHWPFGPLLEVLMVITSKCCFQNHVQIKNRPERDDSCRGTTHFSRRP